MKGKSVILLFVIIIIFSTQFFNWAYWKQFTGGIDIYYYILYPLIVLLAIPNISPLIIKNTLYSKDVLSIFFVSFFCVIPIIFYKGGISTDLDLPPMLFSMTILTYFLLIRKKVSPKSLINCITCIGVFVFFIQIIQQINPSLAAFGIVDSENNSFGDVASTRNNLYRFLLPTYQLSLVCMYYWWSRMLEKRSILTISFFVIFAISTYLYLTRQIIFVSIIVLALTPFLKKSHRLSSKFLPILFIAILYVFGSSIFGEFIEMTKTGGDSTDNRLLAYTFFFEKIIASPISFLLGNGTPPETIYWHDLGLNASDIGVVGEVFHKGIFSLIILLALLYKLIVKNSRNTPFFIRAYAVFCLLNSMLSFPYLRGYEYFLWAILLYMSEKQSCLEDESCRI